MLKSPAFQFYVQDFLIGTSEFTSEQVGGYIRLLAHQWDKGGLINDDKKLLKLSGVKSKALEVIKEKFEVDQDGLLRNHRLEKERAKQLEWKNKSAEAGRKSGEIRRIKKRTNVEPAFNQPSTTLEPNTQPNANQTRTLQSSSSSSSSTTAVAVVALGMKKVKEVANEVWNDALWREGVCMGCSITEQDLKKWMSQFNVSVSNDALTDFEAPKYKKIFRGFLNSEISKGVTVGKNGHEAATIPARHVKLNQ